MLCTLCTPACSPCAFGARLGCTQADLPIKRALADVLVDVRRARVFPGDALSPPLLPVCHIAGPKHMVTGSSSSMCACQGHRASSCFCWWGSRDKPLFDLVRAAPFSPGHHQNALAQPCQRSLTLVPAQGSAGTPACSCHSPPAFAAELVCVPQHWGQPPPPCLVVLRFWPHASDAAAVLWGLQVNNKVDTLFAGSDAAVKLHHHAC